MWKSLYRAKVIKKFLALSDFFFLLVTFAVRSSITVCLLDERYQMSLSVWENKRLLFPNIAVVVVMLVGVFLASVSFLLSPF